MANLSQACHRLNSPLRGALSGNKRFRMALGALHSIPAGASERKTCLLETNVYSAATEKPP